MNQNRESLMNKVMLGERTIRVSKFHSLALARQCASQSVKPTWIVMGDYDDPWGGFWTCRPVDAGRLEKAGYELTY